MSPTIKEERLKGLTLIQPLHRVKINRRKWLRGVGESPLLWRGRRSILVDLAPQAPWSESMRGPEELKKTVINHLTYPDENRRIAPTALSLEILRLERTVMANRVKPIAPGNWIGREATDEWRESRITRELARHGIQIEWHGTKAHVSPEHRRREEQLVEDYRADNEDEWLQRAIDWKEDRER